MEQPLTDNAQRVKAQLDALVRLQVLDHEILARREGIGAATREIERIEQTKSDAKHAMERQKQELDKLTKDRRDTERTAKEYQEQIAKLGGQLYDVKTNEAYTTLQNEIKQKKQELAAMEERVLEMMLSEDELKASQANAAKAASGQEQEFSGQQDSQRRTVAALEAEIAKLQVQWDEAAKAVEPDYLQRYQKLRDAKGGIAMAKIENGTCMGCRLHIRPQAAIELQKYRSLLFCDNCARILYVD